MSGPSGITILYHGCAELSAGCAEKFPGFFSKIGLTNPKAFAILCKSLDGTGVCQQAAQKDLKKSKKRLDKWWTVWYTVQAAQSGAGARRQGGEKRFVRAEKRLDKSKRVWYNSKAAQAVREYDSGQQKISDRNRKKYLTNKSESGIIQKLSETRKSEESGTKKSSKRRKKYLTSAWECGKIVNVPTRQRLGGTSTL